jgi:drug/metabolite transporter (DMT)-like permease
MADRLAQLAFIAIYAATSAYGLYRIKAAPRLLSLDFGFGFLLYGVGFLMWLYLLRKYPLSLVFPIAVGGLIIATQLLANTLLRETLTSLHVAGVLMIVLGIALVSYRV